MSQPTIFDKIVDGSIPSWKIWEDNDYLAFLTPFASTPGATVVIPKHNPGDDIFAIDPAVAAGLVQAASAVAAVLKRAFGTERIAMVFEGEAVPHVHAKLYPMHGLLDERPAPDEVFYPKYPGFIDTRSGPRMSDQQLTDIQQQIVQATHEN